MDYINFVLAKDECRQSKLQKEKCTTKTWSGYLIGSLPVCILSVELKNK